MRQGVGPADALGELRGLLFGGETRRMDDVESELRRLAAAKLDRADLMASTAEVLSAALRRAEVDRHRELADALAPLIVAAIQAEIRNSKDSLVEALYPLMGRLISAAVANSIRQLSEDLARQVDALMSAQRWKWRLKALVTGRPIGEVALADSQRARIVRILCLERHSGTLIAVWPDAETDGRSDLVSGMIAAITEFAATTFAREGGALRALDLGPQNVLLRSSATITVAAECEGVLQQADEQRIDAAFLDLIGRHERAGALGAGELAALGGALKSAELDAPPGPAARWIVRIAGAAAAAALIWWVVGAAIEWRLERRIEAALRAGIAAAPDAAAYPLRVAVDHDGRRAVLTGLLPDAALEGKLMPALRAAAEPYAVEARVDVVAGQAAAQRQARDLATRVDALERRIAADSGDVAARLAALTGDIGKARGEATARSDAADAALRDAAARLDALAQDVSGARAQAAQEAAQLRREAADAPARAAEAVRTEAVAKLAQSADQIAETRRTIEADLAALRAETGRLRAQADQLAAEAARPQARLRDAASRAAIFFSRNNELADRAAAAATIERIAALAREANVALRVVGHTDDSGAPDLNLRLSRERAEAVARLLTEKGVPAHQIVTASRRANMPISDIATAASSPNRRVTFELLLDQEPLQ